MLSHDDLSIIPILVGSSRKEAEDSPADGQLLENIVPGNGPIAR